MKLRLADAAAARALAAHLRRRGFCVHLHGAALEVRPRDHVSARHDRLRVCAAVREWLAATGGSARVEAEDARAPGYCALAPAA